MAMGCTVRECMCRGQGEQGQDLHDLAFAFWGDWARVSRFVRPLTVTLHSGRRTVRQALVGYVVYTFDS